MFERLFTQPHSASSDLVERKNPILNQPHQPVPSPEVFTGPSNTSTPVFQKIVTGLLFITLAFGLAIERSIGVCANFILLSGLVAFFMHSKRASTGISEAHRGDQHRLIFLVIAAMGLVSIVSFIASNTSYHQLSRLDLPVRYLIAAPCFLALCRIQLSIQVIFFGSVLGAFLAATLGLYHFITTHDITAAGAVGHHILFGCLSALLGTMSLALSPCQHRLSLSVLGHAAFIAGFTAASLSGSRGAWMGCAVLALLIMVYRLKLTNIKTHSKHERTLQWMMSATLLLLVVLLFSLFNSVISPRLQLITQELQGYFQGQAPISSIGARLEMWKTALLIFLDHPVLGAGPKTFLEESQLLIDSGMVNNFRQDYAYQHAHNQYLDTLATTGLLGLISLLIFYFVPLYYYLKTLVNPQSIRDKSFAWVGLVTVIGFLVFGLTETLFDRHLSTVFYLVLITTSLSQLSHFNLTQAKMPYLLR